MKVMAQGFGKIKIAKHTKPSKKKRQQIDLKNSLKNLFELAIKYQKNNQYSSAIKICQDILEKAPEFTDAWYLLGNIYYQQNKISLAIEAYQKILSQDPERTDILNNLSILFIKQNKYKLALDNLHKIIKIKPDYVEAYNNLGQLYQDLNQPQQAQIYLEQAILLQPEYGTAYYNLGNVYKSLNRLSLAISYYQKALKYTSDHLDTYNNLGNTYLNCGEVSMALSCYHKILQLTSNKNNLISPTILKSEQNLLFALHYNNQVSGKNIYQQHWQWGQKYQSLIKPVYKRDPNSITSAHKIKIGYVSHDLKQHSVSYFLRELLKNHDQEHFLITCYAANNKLDKVTEKLKSLVDEWRDISSLSYQEAAELIYRDRIDILVDLGGHTDHNRLLIFAYKPAPIQVTYLGYPNTTGLSRIDYRFTDNYCDPRGKTEKFHTETLVRLPQSFLCYQPSLYSEINPIIPFQRNQYITFGSFNNLAKVSEKVISYWGKILQQVPQSKLFLKSKALEDTEVCDRIFQLFAQQEINRERLILKGWLKNNQDHLAAYNEVDIALDTYPYHGTTTTCEALYMGVPVITLAGKVHVSRVGVSLLSNVGLSEFIANNSEEYIDQAIKLANNSQKLSQLRNNLRPRMHNSPLMNGKQVTKDIESAYQDMWQKWCQQKLS